MPAMCCPVGAHVETKSAAVANGEVRHDLWKSPDRPTGLQGEGWVDRQVVDDAAVAERPQCGGRPSPAG